MIYSLTTNNHGKIGRLPSQRYTAEVIRGARRGCVPPPQVALRGARQHAWFQGMDCAGSRAVRCPGSLDSWVFHRRSGMAAIATATAHSALIRQYCVGCHNNSLKTADISFQGADLTKVGGDPALWEKALRKLQTNQMPPAGMPKPARRSQARASHLPGNRIGPRSGHSSKSRKPDSSSPEPRGIQQRDPRLAGAGYPPERQPSARTIRGMGSTTLATSFRYLRCWLSGISPLPARWRGLPWATLTLSR